MSIAVTLRHAAPLDVLAITKLIRRTVRQSNRPDYSPKEIEHLIDLFSKGHIAEMLMVRTVLVAVIAGSIIGTASLSEDHRRVHLVFVDPDMQAKGIGKILLGEIERLAGIAGTRTLSVHASRTSVEFYAAQGYVAEGPEQGELSTRPMIKTLSPSDSKPPSTACT